MVADVVDHQLLGLGFLLPVLVLAIASFLLAAVPRLETDDAQLVFLAVMPTHRWQIQHSFEVDWAEVAFAGRSCRVPFVVAGADVLRFRADDHAGATSRARGAFARMNALQRKRKSWLLRTRRIRIRKHAI